MGAPDNANSSPIVHRVRRRNQMLHVTFTSGRPMLVLPAEVNNPYRSRFTYGMTGGCVDVKRTA
ncbi:hypothetical protein ABZY58_11245 [Micromonospora tulbaghiae]|uniref:hypothetical protein n=1 Tax=Micromonospora tulbaghiae TaxID=479978 RepID=UPI00339FDCA0